MFSSKRRNKYGSKYTIKWIKCEAKPYKRYCLVRKIVYRRILRADDVEAASFYYGLTLVYLRTFVYTHRNDHDNNCSNNRLMIITYDINRNTQGMNHILLFSFLYLLVLFVNNQVTYDYFGNVIFLE